MPGDGETRVAKHSGSVVIGTASVGRGIRNARMYLTHDSRDASGGGLIQIYGYAHRRVCVGLSDDWVDVGAFSVRDR